MESEIFCRKCSNFQEKKGGGVPSFDRGQPPRQGRRDATDGKIHEIGDLFTSFDFIILHARIADICEDHRTAVHYYKKALAWLRPGQMRSEVLEEIARIAI